MSSDIARLVGQGQQVYSDADLIAELRRAAALMPEGALTTKRFRTVSDLATTTFLRRFGSWRQALHAAGLADRYSGQQVTGKMRQQRARTLTDAELLSELRRIAQVSGRPYVTRSELRRLSTVASDVVYIGRFGSWPAALTAAGLTVAPRGRYWTDHDLETNLRTVIAHHRHPPMMADLDRPPSAITSNTYRRRYGSLQGALDKLKDPGSSNSSA